MAVLERFYKYDNGSYVFRINKEVYSKEVLLQVAYVLLEDLTMFLDADDKYFYIYAKPKNDLDEERIVEMIMDELVEANAYIDQMKRTKEIREILLEKALLTNALDSEDILEEERKLFGDLEDEFYLSGGNKDT